MTRQVKLIVAAVVVACVAGCALAEAQPPGVGPNGENGGLTAKFADVNGIRTHYYDEGSGEPMVLVHGSGFAGTASANTWVPVIGLLSKRFHVYAPDKLASGMTDNPKSDDDFTIRAEVEHIVNFIKTLKLGKVHLIGQSRGSSTSTTPGTSTTANTRRSSRTRWRASSTTGTALARRS